ncbi:betaine--homocysteine S-methyltransferase 1-like isoform X4 [Dreissena polymorpha]|uniref:betaine--homocysteine S-methyltransferase 1-like isoform X4 n=1 Tax=Dreissena polymorpha TaxID=45954 RepID=UPI0022656B3E|nr:betaine--homocysteine S-methyltransferase 1-like isoform X4 [Dreissena polymorpha]
MDGHKVKGLVERLRDGEHVLIAEGYMFEFERRGYLQSGGNVPEVVLDYPDLVRNMHREFVHAGSDVVEAFTYYGHRTKLRDIGREDDLERLQKNALAIAREIADETGALMAGNLCGTGIYSADDKDSHATCREMFREQVVWAVEGNCDYIIAETFCNLGEALLALDIIKQYGHGVPAVITLTPYETNVTMDNVPFPEACKLLEDAGAEVVGLNCSRGPATMLPLLEDIRKGPLAAVPVPYRTSSKNQTFFSYKDKETGKSLYPLDINCYMCNRSDVYAFAKKAKAIGIEYIGLCCGNASNLMRELAEAYDRKPPSSKYAPDLSKSIIFGEAGEKSNKQIDKIKKATVGEYVASELAKMHMGEM